MQINIGVITSQWFIKPVAVSGVVRGTLTAYANCFTHESSIVITPTHIVPVSSGYPFLILSAALSFVKSMLIRLPNFCPNSRNGQPLIRHSRIEDRPTPDVSAVRLSAINIKPLISSIKILSSIFHYSPIMEILSSPHHSFTCLRCRTILNCLTWSNRFIAPIIHTYFAHDNWSMCALRPEW